MNNDLVLRVLAVYRYVIDLDWEHDISDEGTIMHWYDTVYMPIVGFIRENKIMKEFPSKTEDDLCL